jgi:hypothetical protein
MVPRVPTESVLYSLYDIPYCVLHELRRPSSGVLASHLHISQRHNFHSLWKKRKCCLLGVVHFRRPFCRCHTGVNAFSRSILWSNTRRVQGAPQRRPTSLLNPVFNGFRMLWKERFTPVKSQRGISNSYTSTEFLPHLLSFFASFLFVNKIKRTEVINN